jgi:FtsP/CotA-like multicopper oxidase with cupredoxin domain
MTTGTGPYVVPEATDADPTATVLETTITAALTTVDIGGGVMANAETYNGAIPGPTLRFNVGDTAIVRLINTLPHGTGIHWHGIELANSADGTEVTQNEVAPAFTATPPAPGGGTYLYKFKLPRPGLYWYHPHHHHSTNRVFKGLYGMIVVADPNEATLISSGVIPGAADTRQLVLSDITVCKAPGANDAATYDPALPWVGGGALPVQPDPAPVDLCEIPPTGSATTDHGEPGVASYGAGDIPSMVRAGRVNEGQTVLTNGVNVGGRAGSPTAPGTLASGAQTMNVLSGQGLRLQIVNCATVRYFRLILTTNTGAQVPLVRIGGEGGLLDNALVEGGVIGGFDTKYTSGEILLPPASRADVVAAIPPGATGVLTLWTQDFQRTGTGFSNIPTVPVMHLNVTGAAATTYTIAAGAALRAAVPGQAVETLGAPDGVLLNPATFVPAKPGLPNQTIQITTPPGIDGVVGNFHDFTPYTAVPHIGSSRYAEQGDTLELALTNTSAAHHPFHLHGFSFQPISLTRTGFPSFTWPYREFRDNLDVPSNYTLTFRVRLDNRELVDGTTLGGSLGRWFFHCHIFFHHHQGMISELVVTDADGSEKPDVSVGGSWAYTPAGGIATRAGTFSHPDGDAVTLTASVGTVTTTGPGTWSWELDSTGMPDQVHYVYITATDSSGRQNQAVFRLKVGAPDDGADNGDPHVHTVDGKRYDFQAVGEFTLLRDAEGMEIQVRHWPVETAGPITDPYTGLTTCVSVNTAVAARVGSHRIAYQPGREGKWLQFYLDGKPTSLPIDGLDLGPHRVSAFTVPGGAVALRVDYAHHAVLTITPYFWSSYNIWLLNVSVAHTNADEGIMGRIPRNTWLPALPNGATVGPMPDSLHERYVTLYRTFADAWRVTDKTSLFVYAPGTSTHTFTDRDWPAEKPPCKLKPEFQVPGANPHPRSIPVERAKKLCDGVDEQGLQADCVFDVATTGDEEFARVYRAEQALRQRATAVQIIADKATSRPGEALLVTATVFPLSVKRSRPTGTIVFLVDEVEAGPPVKLDDRGRARFTMDKLKIGLHKIRATYSGGGREEYHPSSSPSLPHEVRPDEDEDAPRKDLLLPHTFRVPAGHGDKQTQVTLDVKTARRLMAWVNAANRPEDLMQPPEARLHLHVEYRKRGFPERHPAPTGAEEHTRDGGHEHDGGVTEHGTALQDELTPAIEILKQRHEQPVYGFTRIKDLLDIDWLRELLRRWWYYFSRASKGEWTGPYNIPAGGFDRPVHAAVLRTGKVLFFGLPTGKDSWVWTPDAAAAGTIAATANEPADSLFCAGHSFLSDGRLLVVGGGGDGTGPRHNHGWIFDPGSETWTRTAGDGTPGNGDMAFFRWYPTLITMGDEPGRVLVVSGDDTSGVDVRQMEVYSETMDRFERVWGPGGVGDTTAEHSFPQIYPAMHLLPAGEVFYTPTGWHSGGCSGAADFPGAKPSGFYEFQSMSPPIKATWTNVGTQDSAAEEAIDRVKGMAVLLLQPAYPFVQALVVGGGKDPESATTFQMINLSALAPKWGPPVTLPDGLSRVNVNLVALPDGTVFMSGGRPLDGTPPHGGSCWIYDPVLMTWQECDALANKRGYHSVAVLLPDGRVATAGNECPADSTYEVFSPPYLFAPDGTLAPRPQITSLPTQVHHGHEFSIQTPSASTIAKVVLVRPMAVTHQTDSEQRVVQLMFRTSGTTELKATAPNGWHPHGLAPRGWYMMFLVNHDGVPSAGRFMHLH